MHALQGARVRPDHPLPLSAGAPPRDAAFGISLRAPLPPAPRAAGSIAKRSEDRYSSGPRTSGAFGGALERRASGIGRGP